MPLSRIENFQDAPDLNSSRERKTAVGLRRCVVALRYGFGCRAPQSFPWILSWTWRYVAQEIGTETVSVGIRGREGKKLLDAIAATVSNITSWARLSGGRGARARSFVGLDVPLLGGNLDALAADVEPDAAVETHIDVGDPDQ